MLIPISGASTDADNPTGRKTYPAYGSLHTRGGRLDYRVPGRLEIRNVVTRSSRSTVEPGTVRRAEGVIALQAGSPRHFPAYSLIQISGPTIRRAMIALSVTQSRPSLAYPALMRLEVTSSKALRSLALLGMQVHGPVVRRGAAGLTLRGQQSGAYRHILEVQNQFIVPSWASMVIGGVSEGRSLISAQIRSAEDFLILVDLIGADLENVETGTGFFPAQFLNAQLLVGGVDIPIKAFTYQEADGKLGSTLNVTLAQPLISQVPMGATVEFSVLRRNALGVWKGREYVTGKVSSHGLNIAYRGGENGGPADEVVISSVDVLQERFSLAPRRSVIMFDPTKVSLTDVEVKIADAVVDESNNNPIMPVLEAVTGLNLRGALARAYTNRSGSAFTTALTPATLATLERIAYLMSGGPSFTDVGLGFAAVVSNIPNYLISRADFTMESGWHDGIQPLISMFGPMFFAFSDYLHILDIERALPAGYSAYQVPLTKYKSLGLDVPYKDPRNAALLTYKEDLAYGLSGAVTAVTEVIEDTQKSGPDYGSVGHTEIYTQDYVRRYYIGAEMIAETPLSHRVETRTQFQAGDGGAGPLILVHREFQQDFYTGSLATGPLKTGHDKMVEGIISTGPDASIELVEILREKCDITWAADPKNPGSFVQTLTVTQIEGLCYTDDQMTRSSSFPYGATGTSDSKGKGGSAMFEQVVYVPMLLAQSSNIVADDGRMAWLFIKTITERLRPGKGQQVDVETVVVDHLNNTMQTTLSQPRTGNRADSTIRSVQRKVLFRDKVSEEAIGPRIPIGVNGGELPRNLAYEVARRALYRGTHPLTVERLQLPGVDFAIGKGSIVQPQVRDGSYAGKYVVTALTITGRNLGVKGQHRIDMALEGMELPT